MKVESRLYPWNDNWPDDSTYSVTISLYPKGGPMLVMVESHLCSERRYIAPWVIAAESLTADPKLSTWHTRTTGPSLTQTPKYVEEDQMTECQGTGRFKKIWAHLNEDISQVCSWSLIILPHFCVALCQKEIDEKQEKPGWDSRRTRSVTCSPHRHHPVPQRLSQRSVSRQTPTDTDCP